MLKQFREKNPLVALYIEQSLIGFGIAALFVALLLWFNIANLWHLVSSTQGGYLGVVVMWVLHGIVFAGVQFGIRVMGMAEE